MFLLCFQSYGLGGGKKSNSMKNNTGKPKYETRIFSWARRHQLAGPRRAAAGCTPRRYEIPQTKGSQTFALQVQHDGQRVPLQHLLALVVQLNSQCGSPAFLDKGKGRAGKHCSWESPPSPSPCWPRPHHWDPCFSSPAARIPASLSFKPLSSASREDGTRQLVGP